MSTGASASRPAPRYARLPKPILTLCGLAVTAGVIHVVATIQHLDADWRLPVFFAVVGIGQLLAGWWIYSRPEDQRVLKATAVGGVAVALIWVLSRTVGFPGPDAGEVEKAGVADTIATLQEFAFAAIVVALLRRPERGDRRLAWMSSAIGVRLTSAIMSASLFAAALGGHEH